MKKSIFIRVLITLTVMLPTLLEVIDTTVVNVSLKHIAASLSAGLDESTWTITSYLVSNAIIIPLTGWLSKQFGRKNYLIFSVFLFTLSSFLSGCAWSLQSLIFFRVLQGIGGGALGPLSQAILLESYPHEERGMAMAYYGIGVMFGPLIGPLMGGWITDNWSWHWIFYINVPIGLIAIILAFLFIEDPPYLKREKTRIDFAGIGLLCVGLGALQFVLDKGLREDWFSSNLILWFTVIAIFCLVLFVIIEHFSKNPVVDLKIFRHSSFSLGCIVLFIIFFVLFGSIILLPMYLQTLMGYTALLAGFVLGPGGIATLLVMPLVGILTKKINQKFILIFGIVTNGYAVYEMSRFTLYADFATVIWPRFLMGIGMACIFIPLTTLTVASVKQEEMGNATSLYNLFRNLAGSCGTAFVTTILSTRSQFHQARLIERLNPLNPDFRNAASALSTALQSNGVHPSISSYGGQALIHGELLRQSSMMAFNDISFITFIMMFLTLPLVALLKNDLLKKQKE